MKSYSTNIRTIFYVYSTIFSFNGVNINRLCKLRDARPYTRSDMIINQSANWISVARSAEYLQLRHRQKSRLAFLIASSGLRTETTFDELIHTTTYSSSILIACLSNTSRPINYYFCRHSPPRRSHCVRTGARHVPPTSGASGVHCERSGRRQQ